MKYTVDGWNNFCRVFELPKEFPKGFCFGGGKPVTFTMVDWFNPIPQIAMAAVSKAIWIKEVGEIKVIEVDMDEFENEIMDFIKKKQYAHKGSKYLILYDFGASTSFTA